MPSEHFFPMVDNVFCNARSNSSDSHGLGIPLRGDNMNRGFLEHCLLKVFHLFSVCLYLYHQFVVLK